MGSLLEKSQYFDTSSSYGPSLVSILAKINYEMLRAKCISSKWPPPYALLSNSDKEYPALDIIPV